MTLDYDPDLLPTLTEDRRHVRWPDGTMTTYHPYLPNLFLAYNAEKARADAAEKQADRAISVTKELSEKVYDLEHAVTRAAYEARPAVDSVDPRALCVLGVDSDGHKRILISAEDLADGEAWSPSLALTTSPAIIGPPSGRFPVIQVAERTPKPETVTLTVSRDIAEQAANWIVNDHDLLAIATAARRALAGEDADA
jgi:hypothetical protein